LGVPAGSPAAQAPKVEVAFYRKYTEAMLRRYLKLSTDAGRTPSMLGREMFRGNVTSYRAHSFEDVVVFCIDVEKCLERLNAMDRELVKWIAMQHYTQGETAGRLGISLRSCAMYYNRALDRLTGILIEGRLLEPLKGCQ
jgi:hypothetical protein